MKDLPRTVHLVDDDDDVRGAIARLLRLAGYKVICHAGAREFLTQGRDDGRSCILLDVHMPGIGGLDVQRILAQAGDRRPIIFLTGAGDTPSRSRALETGAVDFLTKPVEVADLKRALGEAFASIGDP